VIKITGATPPETIRDILIASVGGQGGILTARILADGFRRQGWQVKTSEVHGMAQRGGSVETHVRRGSQVHSPLIPRGEADVLLALEQLEGLRYLPWLRPGGLAVVSSERIAPVSVTLGGAAYPADGEAALLAAQGAGHGPGCIVLVDALAIATEAGHPRTSNVALVGTLSLFLDGLTSADASQGTGVPGEPALNDNAALWEEVIAADVPPRAREANLKAFRLARELVLSSVGR